MLTFKKRLLDRTRKLSRRQRRVTQLVAHGLKNREIATVLGIDAHVVRNYVSDIYDKIGVNNRVELALWYEARRHEAEIMPKIEQHGREKHNMKIDDETRKKVHNAIQRKAA
jgi:DNA-binding CsgD family transcriptional regulator